MSLSSGLQQRFWDPKRGPKNTLRVSRLAYDTKLERIASFLCQTSRWCGEIRCLEKLSSNGTLRGMCSTSYRLRARRLRHIRRSRSRNALYMLHRFATTFQKPRACCMRSSLRVHFRFWWSWFPLFLFSETSFDGSDSSFVASR